MSANNVFIEAFQEKIPYRLVPLSTPEQIREALLKVDAVNNLYVKDNDEPLVDPEWLSASTLDFMDWMHAHTPAIPEYKAYRMFEDIPFVQQCLTYSTIERIEMFHAENNVLEGPSEKQILNARLIADALTATPSAVTISYSTQEDEGETIFVPSCSYEELVDHEIADASSENDEEASMRLVCWTECFHMALKCLMDGFGAITLCVHEQDSIAIGGLAILNNIGWVISGDSLAQACYTVGGENLEQLLEMAHSMPKYKLEAESRIVAAALINSIAMTMDVASDYMIEKDIDEFAVFAINPFATAVDFAGDATVYILPPEVTTMPLPNLFDAVLELDPFFTGSDASECVYAACVVRGASELIEKGVIEDVLTEISEFSSFMALDSNDRPFDRGVLYTLEQAESFRDEERTLEMMGEMYAELNDVRKREVDVIVNAITDDLDAVKNVLLVDESEKSDNGTAKAQSIYVPPMLNTEMMEENRNRIRAFCTQCVFAPSMTMFIVKKATGAQPSFISGLSWSGGKWSDYGMEKTLEFLETSNIGEFLDISPREPLDYRKIERPSTED